MATDADRQHIADVARRLLDQVVSTLEAQRVLPVSPYHPYIRVGTDYFGDDIRRLPAHDEFEQVVAEAYPGRFGEERPVGDREFAATYLFSFLEAAVTECTRRGEPVAGGSGGTAACVDELLAALDNPEIDGAACRFVAHLTTTTGSRLTCCDIEIIPLDSSREAERLVPSILPRAIARLRNFPFVYSPPHALLVARGRGANQEELGLELSGRIENFLLAVRLLRSASAAAIYEFRGATTSVGPYDPTFASAPAIIGGFRRTARIAIEDERPLEAIAALTASTRRLSPGMVIEPLAMGFHKYLRSYEAGHWYEHLADLTTALEATLSGTDKLDITLRIRSRAAALLATEEDPAERIFDDLGELYDLRSTVVHGGALKEKELRKKITKLNPQPPEHAFGRTNLDLSVDRLRDLVRRSLVARMCLATGDSPPWPLTQPPPRVDSILSEERNRQAWRRHWHEQLEAVGAEEAGRPATKAVAWISPHKDDPR